MSIAKIVSDIRSLDQDAIPYIILTTLCTAAGILYILSDPPQPPPIKKSTSTSTSSQAPTLEVDEENVIELAVKPREYTDLRLLEVIKTSHNTAIYRFELKRPDTTLNVPIGQHLSVRAVINGKAVTRSYSPITGPSVQGYFDLLLKTYNTPNMSDHISKLVPGKSTLSFSGPKGSFLYTPSTPGSPPQKIGLIAGGTGITPIYPILLSSLGSQNPGSTSADMTEFTLLYSNRTPDDILLRSQLDALALASNGRFKIQYMLTGSALSEKEKKEWKGGLGRIGKEMVKEWMPAPAEGVKILMCGPKDMMSSMKGYLSELGYQPPKPISKPTDQIFIF